MTYSPTRPSTPPAALEELTNCLTVLPTTYGWARRPSSTASPEWLALGGHAEMAVGVGELPTCGGDIAEAEMGLRHGDLVRRR